MTKKTIFIMGVLYVICVRVGLSNNIDIQEKEPDEWVVLVGSGKNAKEEDYVQLKMALRKNVIGQMQFSVLSSTNDPWIVINKSRPGAQDYYQRIVEQEGFEWVMSARVEAIGFDRIINNQNEPQLVKNFALVSLNDTYKPMGNLSYIAVRTNTGLVVMTKSKESFTRLKGFAGQ